MRRAMFLLGLLASSCDVGDVRSRFVSNTSFDFDYGLLFGLSEDGQRTTDVEAFDTRRDGAAMVQKKGLERVAIVGIDEADIRAETLRFSSGTSGMGFAEQLPAECADEGELHENQATQSVALPKHRLFIAEVSENFRFEETMNGVPELARASLSVPVVPEQCGNPGPEVTLFGAGPIITPETTINGRQASKTPRLRDVLRVNHAEAIVVLDQWVVLTHRDAGFVDGPGRAIDFGSQTVLRTIGGLWKGDVLRLVVAGYESNTSLPDVAVVHDLEYTQASGLRLLQTATRTASAKEGIETLVIDPETERTILTVDPNRILVRDTLDGPIVQAIELTIPPRDVSRPLLFTTKIPEFPFALAGWGRGRLMLGDPDGRVWTDMSAGFSDSSVQGLSARVVDDHVELWAGNSAGELFRFRWGGPSPDTQWVAVPLRLAPSVGEIGCASPKRDACGWISKFDGSLAHVHALPTGPVLSFTDKCRITISLTEERCVGYRPFEVEPPYPLDNAIDAFDVSEGWLTLGSRDGSIYSYARTPR